MEIPIEVIYLFLTMCIVFPVLILLIDKSKPPILLDMSLMIIGIMWIVLFGFTIDSNTTFNDTIMLNNEETGEPTILKMFITFFGVGFILIGALSEYSGRISGF